MLTVGIPVCNAMPWLPEAMESLFRQTTSAFEILVIVDGGTDGSLDYLRRLRQAQISGPGHEAPAPRLLGSPVRGPRLRVLHQPHAGLTATLNRMLAETRTPWLVRQDADDVSYPQRIEVLLARMHSRPEASLIYSLADYHPRGRCAGRFRCSRGSSRELRDLVESGYLLSICHSTVAMNVEKALAVGGYRMDIHAEDADLWWRLALRYPIEFIPEALVGFRQNESSVSSHNLEKQELAGIYVQYLLLSELWGLAPQPLEHISGVLTRFLRPSGIIAKRALRSFNMDLAQRRFLRGAADLARAAAASPTYFLRRVRDEFRSRGIANGVSPRLFLEQKEALWP